MKGLIGLAALLVVSGAWAQQSYVDFDKEADFESYKTFTWVQSDEDLSETSPLWHERVRNGITERMVEGGMTEVTGDEIPDVYVTYYASESQTTRVIRITWVTAMGAAMAVSMEADTVIGAAPWAWVWGRRHPGWSPTIKAPW